MYAFPKIKFPENILKKAKEQNIFPDLYYCLSLIEKTGIVTVPGSGFEQKAGSWNIRLTNLLCPKEELVNTLKKIEKFNETFFDS